MVHLHRLSNPLDLSWPVLRDGYNRGPPIRRSEQGGIPIQGGQNRLVQQATGELHLLPGMRKATSLIKRSYCSIVYVYHTTALLGHPSLLWPTMAYYALWWWCTVKIAMVRYIFISFQEFSPRFSSCYAPPPRNFSSKPHAEGEAYIHYLAYNCPPRERRVSSSSDLQAKDSTPAKLTQGQSRVLYIFSTEDSIPQFNLYFRAKVSTPTRLLGDIPPIHIALIYVFFFHTLLFSRFWTSRGHRSRPFFPPRVLPSIFIAHRVQQSHCSSIFHQVLLLTRALALSASQFVHK